MKQATSPAKITAYAKTRGVEFSAERVGHTYSVECWSPKGKVWANHFTHFVALEADGYFTTPNWQVTLDELKAEIAAGFEDCDTADCDVCNEL